MFIGGEARPVPANEVIKPGPDTSEPFIKITLEHLARQMYV
jgi:hypothetical protein